MVQSVVWSLNRTVLFCVSHCTALCLKSLMKILWTLTEIQFVWLFCDSNNICLDATQFVSTVRDGRVKNVTLMSAEIRTSGAIPLLPQYAFMACSEVT